MAATDKTYRRQHTLDIVFAISSLAMLASIIWMFVDDYNRPYKAEQRNFREVESALAQRVALSQVPTKEEFDAKKSAFDEALKKYDGHKDELIELKRDLGRMKPTKESADAAYNAIKADQSSVMSFYNIAKERGDEIAADEYAKQLIGIDANLARAQANTDEINAKMKEKQLKIDEIEKPLTDAQSAWKKVTDKFDTQVKVANTKQWRWHDSLRNAWFIDAFGPPIKIQQITNNDIPIDYNFKMVTRFDRCTTCHLGIDRPTYTKEALRALTQDPSADQQKRLDEARALLGDRIKAYSELPTGAPGKSDASRLPQPSQLAIAKVDPSVLTEGRISEYAAHPRLELFVGANSKHPMEKFGCSACHSGQGSATDFTLAAHTPNTAPQKDTWVKQHDWEAQHMWDFPMLPQRFVESSCIKCHHEVTDLISSNNREEAPKLLRGYSLIKENGCFGCHEIAGIKAGKAIGPDLRLEPYPPMEDLTASERVKMEQDTENPPGHMRKVGPSLFRLKEKTNLDWTVKWIRAPRDFRPDTKMPHFYGNSNNSRKVLENEAPEQKDFPDAEINAIAHYLFKVSGQYLNDVAAQHNADKQKPEAGQADDARLDQLIAKGKDKLNATEQGELTAIRNRIKLRKEKILTDLAPNHPGDPAEGRRLFTERGCMACHSHEGTTATQGSKNGPDGSPTKDYVPAVHGQAQFGPNLSQVAAKLGRTAGDKKSARVWLIQWVTDPHVHSPRSRMPVTHLTAHEAADIAAWLLSQRPADLGADWDQLAVPEPDVPAYKDLARVYLVRLLPKSDIDALLEQGKLNQELVNDLPVDEKEFVANYTKDKMEGLKHYVGKKAIGRLGCYACHDVPGFESFRPIGTGLNDWGKKDPGRLAFENIDNFVEHNFYSVPTWSVDGKIPGARIEKINGHDVTQKPYEAFYFNDLLHHNRTGYLHQKILDPRSYDYGKKLAWDDRARMPEFRFARTHKKEGETDADFEARKWKDEADAREAVMTFILGLVADPIPAKMRNRPTGDRLMEVKGRQVIDKYNCAGCHMIRPGSYEFNVSPDALKDLERAHTAAESQTSIGGMYTFPMHQFWTGKNPLSPDRLIASGVQPRLTRADEEDPASPAVLQLVLAEALRFVDSNKALVDLPTYTNIFIPLTDFDPALKDAKSLDDVKRMLGPQLQLGGTFADLMVPYLVAKDKSVYKPDEITKDSPQARASLPPSLIGEGERTQPQWLYQFLLNPSAVRRMTILRMPKFNISPPEAKALVGYFAGVERISNPGIGLTYPGDHIPQQAPLDDPFWIAKTSEYIARLKSSGQYDERLKAYADSWNQAAKLADAALQLNVAKVKQQQQEFEKLLKAKKAELDKAKDKDKLQKEITDLEVNLKGAADQLKAFDDAAKESTPGAFKQAWLDKEAYVADAYRMIVNKVMCLQCHEVGGFKSSNPITQGPPLALANERLRPDWVLRWISTPQRHITYESLMPVNFPRGKMQFQDVLVGQPPQQLEAMRDLLMNYPRVYALPVNQQWNPNLQPAAVAAEKK